MKIDVILHPGLPRTATTFLQQNIFPNIQNTQLFPKIPRRNMIKQKHVIISNEMFSMVPERHQMLDVIKKTSSQTRIILGLRDYKEILYTLYNHLVTYGLHLTRKEWEKQQPKEIRTYINYLERTFKDVYMYRFNDFKKHPDTIIEEIAEFIGEPVPEYKLEDINPAPRDDQYIENIRRANTLLISDYNKKGILPRHYVKKAHYFHDGTIGFTIDHPAVKQIIEIKNDMIIFKP